MQSSAWLSVSAPQPSMMQRYRWHPPRATEGRCNICEGDLLWTLNKATPTAHYFAMNWAGNCVKKLGAIQPIQPLWGRSAVGEGITWRFETRWVCSDCQVIPQQARNCL